MKNWIKKLIFFVLLAGTIAVAVWDVKVTYDEFKTKNEIYYRAVEAGTLANSARSEIEEWQDYTISRLFTFGFVIVFYGITLFFVLYTGPEKKKAEHISREDANRLMDSLDEIYEKQGFLASSDDAEEQEEEEPDDIPETLEQPKITRVSFSNRSVIVTWRSVPYAEGYTVWRRYDKEAWTKLATVKTGDTFYMDYALESNRRYAYSVKAFLTTEDKKIVSSMDPLGMDVLVETGNVLPAPTMEVTEDEEGRRKLTWIEVKGATGYRIYRRPKGSFKWRKCGFVKREDRMEYIETEQLSDTYFYAVSSVCKVNHVPVAGEHSAKGVRL